MRDDDLEFALTNGFPAQARGFIRKCKSLEAQFRAAPPSGNERVTTMVPTKLSAMTMPDGCVRAVTAVMARKKPQQMASGATTTQRQGQ